ncbi:hypothetical protein Tco_1253149 [Tanacetum coccineum]
MLAAALMANLFHPQVKKQWCKQPVKYDSTTDANQIFDNVNHLLTHEIHQEEHLDSDVESDIDDNTIQYHQYQLDNEVQDVLTEEQSLVNDSLIAELARCKQEMVSLERNKVKHDLDQTIVQRNKPNAELEEERNCVLKFKTFSKLKGSSYQGIRRPPSETCNSDQTYEIVEIVGHTIADSITERLKRATTYVLRQIDFSLLSREHEALLSFELSFKLTSSEHSDLNFRVAVIRTVFGNRLNMFLKKELTTPEQTSTGKEISNVPS